MARKRDKNQVLPGRDGDRVNAWLDRRFPKYLFAPRPKDPCPCGSRLRFEHCHMGEALNTPRHKKRQPSRVVAGILRKLGVRT